MHMLIDIQDLQFAYSGSAKTVLSIDRWQIEEKQHTFIHGPSGTGKSTLLNILSGILSGYQGNVAVLGQSLSQLSSRQRDRFRARHIGYVFQQFNLVPYLNSIDNIQLANEFSTKADKQSIDSILSLLVSLNISQEEAVKPVSQLSIGQQQRVAIARSMINEPELLIADEPTSSLDQDNRDSFIDLLMNKIENTNTTLLFVSHDQSLSSHFDNVQSLNEISRS